jgi:hypothetical protein
MTQPPSGVSLVRPASPDPEPPATAVQIDAPADGHEVTQRLNEAIEAALDAGV